MFLAAAPYFSSRFLGDAWIQANFQSTILAVSTVTNLGTMLILTNIQSSASYSFRINLALLINIGIFTLLTASTAAFLDASPRAYLGFVLAMVASTSMAAGLLQNGAYAFTASFGRSEYMQALMAGQGVAGILPPLAEVTTVLLFPPEDQRPATDNPHRRKDEHDVQGEKSAFIYFLTAVIISVVTIVIMIPLIRRRNDIIESRVADRMGDSIASIEDAERASRKSASMWHLFKKLRWLATGAILTFTVTMLFPVFTVKILSVRDNGGPLFRPAAFIPLGFFFWNLGDLAGRISTAFSFSLKHRPLILFLLSVSRIALVPLYFLCNIGGHGAVVSSDFFYLFVVQIVFGFTNGWLGTSVMVATSEWVDEGEREAASGFMGLCLVAGLTLGSFLSFTISGL